MALKKFVVVKVILVEDRTILKQRKFYKGAYTERKLLQKLTDSLT